MGVGRASRPVLFPDSVRENSLGRDRVPRRSVRTPGLAAAIATVTVSEQDLRGSDLENMSLSKRFLKEGERGGVSRAHGAGQGGGLGIRAVCET